MSYLAVVLIVHGLSEKPKLQFKKGPLILKPLDLDVMRVEQLAAVAVVALKQPAVFLCLLNGSVASVSLSSVLSL